MSQIRESAVARLTHQQRMAEANGFSLAPPRFDLGTAVNQTGVDNFTKSRQEWDVQAKLSDVAAPFMARIESEARRDIAVPVSALRLTESGEIVRHNGDPAKTLLLDGALSLRSLLDRTPCEEPGAAATYLACVPPGRRAAEVNSWLAATPVETTAVLRTRLALTEPDVIEAELVSSESRVPSGSGMLTLREKKVVPYGREVFAVVSQRYGTGCEVDVLARSFLEACARGIFPNDARGEVLYNGRKATIRAIWHSNLDPKDACAGEVFKAGASVSGADDGSSAIEVDGILWRNLCLNFIIIDENHQNFGSRRHVGADLSAWLFDALRAASRSVSGFAELWDSARSQNLATITRDVPEDKTDGEVVAGVFRGLLKTDRLALPGYRGEAAVSEFMNAYRREPEFARVGIVNAITRTAHESALRGVFSSETLEAQGGAVLASKRPFQFVDVGDSF